MEDRITRDLGRVFPEGFDLVFDVGANVGQSAERFHAAWPKARIHAFEPVKMTFDALSARFADAPSIVCENLALGSKTVADAQITANDISTMNAVVESGRSRGPVEQIAIQTGSRYCREKNIKRIGFLKVDTEGYDLKVLIGFVNMLGDHRIDALQVEAGMHLDNGRHVHIGRFLGLLEPLGYSLFGVYDQVREKHAKATLRRANLIFTRNSLFPPAGTSGSQAAG